jgi:O-antigen/teichoic acid export membrane protein
LVLQVGLTVVYGIDNLVIGYALGAQHVPAYAVPFRLIWTANGLFYVAVSAMMPSITRRFSRGEQGNLAGRFATGMRLAILYATSCAIALWLVGPSFIRWWAGPSLYPGALTFGLQVGYLIFLVLATPGYGVVMATTNHYRYAALSVAEAALNLSLSLWWVYRFGIAGVIAGTVVASLLTTSWYLPTAAARILGMDMRRFRREFGAPLLVAFGALGATAVLPHQIGDDSLLRSIAIMCVVELAFVVGFTRLAFSRAERKDARLWITRSIRTGVQVA